MSFNKAYLDVNGKKVEFNQEFDLPNLYINGSKRAESVRITVSKDYHPKLQDYGADIYIHLTLTQASIDEAFIQKIKLLRKNFEAIKLRDPRYRENYKSFLEIKDDREGAKSNEFFAGLYLRRGKENDTKPFSVSYIIDLLSKIEDFFEELYEIKVRDREIKNAERLNMRASEEDLFGSVSTQQIPYQQEIQRRENSSSMDFDSFGEQQSSHSHSSFDEFEIDNTQISFKTHSFGEERFSSAQSREEKGFQERSRSDFNDDFESEGYSTPTLHRVAGVEETDDLFFAENKGSSKEEIMQKVSEIQFDKVNTGSYEQEDTHIDIPFESPDEVDNMEDVFGKSEEAPFLKSISSFDEEKGARISEKLTEATQAVSQMPVHSNEEVLKLKEQVKELETELEEFKSLNKQLAHQLEEKESEVELTGNKIKELLEEKGSQDISSKQALDKVILLEEKNKALEEEKEQLSKKEKELVEELEKLKAENVLLKEEQARRQQEEPTASTSSLKEVQVLEDEKAELEKQVQLLTRKVEQLRDSKEVAESVFIAQIKSLEETVTLLSKNKSVDESKEEALLNAKKQSDNEVVSEKGSSNVSNTLQPKVEDAEEEGEDEEESEKNVVLDVANEIKEASPSSQEEQKTENDEPVKRKEISLSGGLTFKSKGLKKMKPLGSSLKNNKSDDDF